MSYVAVYTGTFTVGADTFRQIAGVFPATTDGELQQHAFSTANAGVDDYRDSGNKAIAVTGNAVVGAYINTSTNAVSESIERVSAADLRKDELQALLRLQLDRADINISAGFLKGLQQIIIGFAEANDANLSDDTRWGRLRAWAAANPNELDYRLSALAKTALTPRDGQATAQAFYALPALSGTGVNLGAAFPAGQWAASPTEDQCEAIDVYAFTGFA